MRSATVSCVCFVAVLASALGAAPAGADDQKNGTMAALARKHQNDKNTPKSYHRNVIKMGQGIGKGLKGGGGKRLGVGTSMKKGSHSYSSRSFSGKSGSGESSSLKALHEGAFSTRDEAWTRTVEPPLVEKPAATTNAPIAKPNGK